MRVKWHTMIPHWLSHLSAHHPFDQFFFAWPLGNVHINQCFFKLFILYWCYRKGWRHSGRSLPTSTKNKTIIQNNNLGLTLKKDNVFIWEFKVGIVVAMQVMTMELWKNLDALVLMDLLNPSLDNGSKQYIKILIAKYLFTNN